MIKGTIRLGTEGYLLKSIDHMLLEAKVRKLFNMPLTVDQRGNASGLERRETAENTQDPWFAARNASMRIVSLFK